MKVRFFPKEENTYHEVFVGELDGRNFKVPWLLQVIFGAKEAYAGTLLMWMLYQLFAGISLKKCTKDSMSLSICYGHLSMSGKFHRGLCDSKNNHQLSEVNNREFYGNQVMMPTHYKDEML